MLTEQQRKIRQSGLGGSDIAAIASYYSTVKISAFKTPVKVYMEKVNDLEDEEESEAMYWGNILEPHIAERYTQKTGNICAVEKEVLRHKKYPWMLANIDRKITNKNGILECKLRNFFTAKEFGEPGTNAMPDDCFFQCVHYAIICDVEFVDLAVWVGGGDYRIYKYTRNERLEEKIIRMEERYWHEHILPKIPPTPKTAEEAALLFPESVLGKTVVINDDIFNSVGALRDIKARIKLLEKEQSKLKAQIQTYMKDGEILIDPCGVKIATWKNQTANRFDNGTFEDLYPDIYAKFCKESRSRVLRLTKGD